MIYSQNECLYFSWLAYGQLIKEYLLRQSDSIEPLFINFIGLKIGRMYAFPCVVVDKACSEKNASRIR